MQSNATLAFGDIDDFQTAMETEGVTSLIATQCGEFRAFLTQISLHSLRLSAIKETLPRIAFVRVPDDRVMLSFSIDSPTPQTWAGMALDCQDVVVIGPGQGIHARLTGPCHWANIWLPTRMLANYIRIVADGRLSVPPGVLTWRPPRSAARQLRDLYLIVIRAVQARSVTLTSAEATHGLEQQVLDALLLAFSERPLANDTADQVREHELMARLEDLLKIGPEGRWGVADLGRTLGVSGTRLRRCCEARFGMTVVAYLKLRRLQSAHRELRKPVTDVLRVADVAERHGFRDVGRFACSYRDFFGELPSATLRRGQTGAFAPLVLRERVGVPALRRNQPR